MNEYICILSVILTFNTIGLGQDLQTFNVTPSMFFSFYGIELNPPFLTRRVLVSVYIDL